MKYYTATTEQRAGQTTPDGTPLAPKPPDQSGDWQLIGLHTFQRVSVPAQAVPPANSFLVAAHVWEWFIHFYWQRATPTDGQEGGNGQTQKA